MTPIKLPSKWTYADTTQIPVMEGKPRIFLTIACNPNCKEIRDVLLPGQTPQDQPYLVSRVFKSKMKKMKMMLAKKHTPGVPKADVHVVEFQQRGLPHAHFMLM